MKTITLKVVVPEGLDEKRLNKTVASVPAEVLAAALLNVLLQPDETKFRNQVREGIRRWVKSTSSTRT